MVGWDLLVRRNDLRATQVTPSALSADGLEAGEVLLQVEQFALTANNITYGAIGDAFGYWKFFPAPEGFGRIPVWGFARVLASRAEGVEPGLRLFGYLPMSTHVVMRLAPGRDGYVDRAAHRAELPPTYNAYAAAPPSDLDEFRSLLRPLLMTSFLLDDFLSEDPAVSTLVLSSASSKTAMGLAWFARRRGRKVVGLTSAGNAQRLRELGLYDQVLAYGEAAGLATGPGAAYVDFAGDRAVTLAAHRALGDDLLRSLIVGGTHWGGRADGRAIARPTAGAVLRPRPDPQAGRGVGHERGGRPLLQGAGGLCRRLALADPRPP